MLALVGGVIPFSIGLGIYSTPMYDKAVRDVAVQVRMSTSFYLVVLPSVFCGFSYAVLRDLRALPFTSLFF
jgi:hypothetical protein